MSARIAVFASGGGSNLQALMDHFNRAGEASAARVELVVSDRPAAGALERAARAGIPARVVEVAGRPDEDVARETLAALEAAGIEFVALAGYLRRIPADVVRCYRGRMTNIHPALLPAFGGKGMYGIRVHRAVLAAGCKVSGATVHLVDEEYDTGPILAQWPVPVLPGDTPEALAARVLRVEHLLYPATLEALVLGVRPGGAAGPGAFCASDTDAPAPEEIRRALGLD
ncbi:MAG TPA: phosphoribosylglycinamide formyltransferase [Longimicrobiales bacterium]